MPTPSPLHNQPAPLPRRVSARAPRSKSTLGLHIRAVTKASALILATTTLLVLWLLAVAGDALWRRPRTDHRGGTLS